MKTAGQEFAIRHEIRIESVVYVESIGEYAAAVWGSRLWEVWRGRVLFLRILTSLLLWMKTDFSRGTCTPTPSWNRWFGSTPCLVLVAKKKSHAIPGSEAPSPSLQPIALVIEIACVTGKEMRLVPLFSTATRRIVDGVKMRVINIYSRQKCEFISTLLSNWKALA